MMGDFNIRADAIDVEQIMERIRARIREKRGVDYTEEELRQLATVKLEKFLDPRVVRSDLLEHYRKGRPSVILPLADEPRPGNFAFDEDTIYASSRSLAGRLIALARRLLNPILKLFFNPNPIISVLHLQGQINTYEAKAFDRIVQKFATRDELDSLNYEVLNNLVVEMTRVGIEVKNLKMRVESLSSRLDFDERRARALESIVQFRTAGDATASPNARPEPTSTGGAPEPSPGGETPSQRAKRRRRRRRRSGGPAETGASSVPAEAMQNNGVEESDIDADATDLAKDSAPVVEEAVEPPVRPDDIPKDR